MAAIPPDIVGSAVQAGNAQRQAARLQEAERTSQLHAARSQARAVDRAADNVETTDDDVQTFSDAEGSGSQGRSCEEELDREAGAADGPNSVVTSGASEERLDIQA